MTKKGSYFRAKLIFFYLSSKLKTDWGALVQKRTKYNLRRITCLAFSWQYSLFKTQIMSQLLIFGAKINWSRSKVFLFYQSCVRYFNANVITKTQTLSTIFHFVSVIVLELLYLFSPWFGLSAISAFSLSSRALTLPIATNYYLSPLILSFDLRQSCFDLVQWVFFSINLL